MRNSILPLAVVIAICLGFILSTRGGALRGQGGPSIDPGIYRAVTNGIYQVESMALTDVPRDFAPAVPEPIGFMPTRRVVVSGDDRAPLTRAIMRSLAEIITARGGTVILDPLGDAGQDMLPPVDAAWCMRIASVSGEVPTAPQGPLDYRFRAHLWTVRPPAGHPACDRVEDGLDRDAVLTMRLACHGVGKGGWPEWFAGVGRTCASALLARAAEGPVAVPEAPMADWGTMLPMPPRLDILRWSAPFQQDFVRGWIGRIDGLYTTAESGTQEPSLDRFAALLGHGGWKPDPQMQAPGFAAWRKAEGDGHLTIHSDAGGHDILVWWEREQPAALFAAWMDALGDGIEPAVERAARSRDVPPPGAPTLPPDAVRARCRAALGRYLHCPIIPADMRAKAAALLAAKSTDAPMAPAAAPPPVSR